MELNRLSVRSLLIVAALCYFLSAKSLAQDHMHGAEMSADGVQGMRMDADGLVMNSNSTELPRDCAEVSEDVEFEVRVGTAYAAEFPGNVFGMSIHEYRVPPCSRVTIRLVNEDEIRHQWMVHGRQCGSVYPLQYRIGRYGRPS